MNLRRQLLLVSLLTLVLPWAGCQFIKETETALREGQQQMLAGYAQAIADSLAQFPAEFLQRGNSDRYGAGQIYAHPLTREPRLDGYFDDWSVDESSQQQLRGADGPIRFVVGVFRRQMWLFVQVPDSNVLYDRDGEIGESITLISYNEEGNRTRIVFSAEAPGPIVARRSGTIEQRVASQWQDTPRGYQLEARLPREITGPMLGLEISNKSDADRAVRSRSFSGPEPGQLVTPSPLLQSVLRGSVQPGLRLIIVDRSGWRLATSGSITGSRGGGNAAVSGWMRRAYNLILEPGEEPALAEPHPSGREQQPYIDAALRGEVESSWFRSPQTGRAVIAVAQPVWSGTTQTGAVVLQQGTDAILSLTSGALTRLMSFTLLATVVAAAALLGYATWLSQRVRRLSRGAQRALQDDRAHAELPSLDASDEIGDLSRSFSSVLKQLGDYNQYLRTLASKLSHELRTPLTIVRSSLDNLDHEVLTDDARQYTSRARDGVERLKKILNAMSEANRVEELVQNVETEIFDLRKVLSSTVAAYADAWPDRNIRFDSELATAMLSGAPELVIQMLDKLVDNAVDFTNAGDSITLTLSEDAHHYRITISNPGRPLPDTMRGQLFDSMVSVRHKGSEHLGLGLFVARLIAEGHNGRIAAENTDDGVRFTVTLRRDGETTL